MIKRSFKNKFSVSYLTEGRIRSRTSARIGISVMANVYIQSYSRYKQIEKNTEKPTATACPTLRINQRTIRVGIEDITACIGMSAIAIPIAQASPIPPRNLRNIGYQCPSIHERPQNTKNH